MQVKIDQGTELWLDGECLMSDRESDVKPMREFCRKAEGKVLCTGLGLGKMLDLLALNPKVTQVTVIEKSIEVMDWYLGLCKTPPFVNIVKGDADDLGFVKSLGKFDCAMIDHQKEKNPEYVESLGIPNVWHRMEAICP